MIEQHVTSLELSKKLKELGIKQNSLFYWWEYKGVANLRVDSYKSEISGDFPYSAFIGSELGEMLPAMISTIQDHAKKWICMYERPTYSIDFIQADTEADCRAKILIYLIENKLWSPNAKMDIT